MPKTRHQEALGTDSPPLAAQRTGPPPPPLPTGSRPPCATARTGTANGQQTGLATLRQRNAISTARTTGTATTVKGQQTGLVTLSQRSGTTMGRTVGTTIMDSEQQIALETLKQPSVISTAKTTGTTMDSVQLIALVTLKPLSAISTAKTTGTTTANEQQIGLVILTQQPRIGLVAPPPPPRTVMVMNTVMITRATPIMTMIGNAIRLPAYEQQQRPQRRPASRIGYRSLAIRLDLGPPLSPRLCLSPQALS